MKNLRERRRSRKASHPDFQWMMSAMCPERSEHSSPKSEKRFRNYLVELKEFDPSFGVLRWGDIGRIEDVRESTHGHIYWIKDVSDHGRVREILESIDFTEVIQYWMGAPSVLIEDLIDTYDKKKQELNLNAKS